MGIISRNPTAPYSNAELLHGTDDLEVDFSILYDEINGGLDDENIVAFTGTSADLDCAKLLDRSVSGTKIKEDEITIAKIATAAVAHHSVSIATSETWPNTNYADCPGITAATENLRAGDMILLDFVATIDSDGASGSDLLRLRWSIDGTVNSAPTFVYQLEEYEDRLFVATYAEAITATNNSVVMKPQVRGTLDNTVAIETAIFRMTVLRRGT